MSANSLRALRALSAVVLLALACALSGCGGGSGPAGSAVTRGAVEVAIRWPERTRYIPPYGTKIRLTLTIPGDEVNRFVKEADRPEQLPATQTVRFDELLKVGSYTLTGEALNEAGQVVAKGQVGVVVKKDETARAALALGTSIARLAVLETPLNYLVGVSRQLRFAAYDAANTALMLPETAVTWAVTTGTAGTVTPAGVFTAAAAGKATVRVTEPGANLSAEAEVTVSVPTGGGGGGGLGDSDWPAPRGNVRNTGQGLGSGATGATQVWKANGGTSAALGPNGLVYTRSQGVVICYNGANGQEVWRQAVGGEAVLTAPTVSAAGVVYVASSRGVLYAFNAASGAGIWQFQYGSGVVPNLNATCALGPDGVVYVAGMEDAKLTALDASSGALKWQTDPQNVGITSTPAIGADGSLYANSSGGLARINPLNGAKVWETDLGAGPGLFAPTLGADGTVYTTSGDDVVAVNGVDGAVKWRQATSSGNEALLGFALSSDGRLYTANTLGKLTALNAASGAVFWTRTLPDPVAAAPTLAADGTLYVGSYHDGGTNGGSIGTLHALRPADGSTTWEKTFTDTIPYEIAVARDGTLIFGFPTVYAIK